MQRIKIDNQTVCVPQSWDDITLGFYETWFDRTPATNREGVELAAEICRVDPSLFFNASPAVFNRIAATLSFAFDEHLPDPSPVIEVNGVKYLAPVSDELTLAQWVDADEMQRGHDKTLSGILAIVCLPQGEQYDPARFDERQQLFASLKMSKVLGMLGFFLRCKSASEHLSQTCFRLRESAVRFLTDTKPFRLAGGGTRSLPSWRGIRFWLLTLWLRYRLRRFLRLSGFRTTSTMPKRRSGSLRNS